MNLRDQQILNLAKSLLRKTLESRITWRPTEKPGRYLYVGRNNSVIVEGPPNLIGVSTIGLAKTLYAGDRYFLKVVDDAGNPLADVQTGMTSRLIGASLESASRGQFKAEVEPVLVELYAQIVQDVNEPNPAIDEFIREIDDK